MLLLSLLWISVWAIFLCPIFIAAKVEVLVFLLLPPLFLQLALFTISLLHLHGLLFLIHF